MECLDEIALSERLLKASKVASDDIPFKRKEASKMTEHEGIHLRNRRKAIGLSQARLAELAGVGCHTVCRWEGKSKFRRRSQALKSILAVLGSLHRYRAGHITRARGDGVLHGQAAQNRPRAGQLPQRENKSRREAQTRVMCGAKTRAESPCRMKSEPGRQRCKFHGGKSTGPKTAEGRERIAEAQRRRWAKARDQLSSGN